MINNDGFEQQRNNISNLYNNSLLRLEQMKQEIEEARKNEDERKVRIYESRIKSIMTAINNYKNILDNMRPHTEEDLIERKNALESFKDSVNETIPDEIPVVFHGSNNISIVKQIIESGGLFTPEQRGVDFRSFATQIDVTSKTNIRVSCEFAENALPTFLPYGAIFAIMPLESEKDKVLATGDSSEVPGGIDGINFIEEPERLVGIITTTENLESLKNKCEECGIDPNKVYTHNQFIEMCINVGLNQTGGKHL